MNTSEFSEPTRRWLAEGTHVEVGGRRIFVHERGEGPTVLLMHGFPTSCYDWRGIVSRMSDSYRCVAFDFLGFGLSDKPIAYSYSLFQQTDIVEELAGSLGIRDAHVVSHDVGVSVHTELLAREEEGRLALKVASSTFLNGSILMEMSTITQFQRLLASNESLPQAIAICDNVGANYVDGLKGLMKRPDVVTEEDATIIRELLLYQDGNRRIPALSGYMRERYIHKDRWVGALKGTKSPIQLVWADGDPVANVEMGRALSRDVPQALYTQLTGLGHFLLMEDPETVAGHILEFIRTA